MSIISETLFFFLLISQILSLRSKDRKKRGGIALAYCQRSPIEKSSTVQIPFGNRVFPRVATCCICEEYSRIDAAASVSIDVALGHLLRTNHELISLNHTSTRLSDFCNNNNDNGK